MESRCHFETIYHPARSDQLDCAVWRFGHALHAGTLYAVGLCSPVYRQFPEGDGGDESEPPRYLWIGQAHLGWVSGLAVECGPGESGNLADVQAAGCGDHRRVCAGYVFGCGHRAGAGTAGGNTAGCAGRAEAVQQGRLCHNDLCLYRDFAADFLFRGDSQADIRLLRAELAAGFGYAHGPGVL